MFGKGLEKQTGACLGLDMGVFSVKGVLIENGRLKRAQVPTAGRPVEAAQKCIGELLETGEYPSLRIGIMGQNSGLVADSLGVEPLLEIEALQAGLNWLQVRANYVLSLGHENMHYLELDEKGQIAYFSRNGQCAAGSGSFWCQQATRMGYSDRELASIALDAETVVPISGRCAVFAKSDMTHAINEGATQGAVSAGMAQALVENMVTSVAQNRIEGSGVLATVGGVAANRAVLKYIGEYAAEKSLDLVVPADHLFVNAVGAAVKGEPVDTALLKKNGLTTPAYCPDKTLPALDPLKVVYHQEETVKSELNLERVYLGVDCGSVSTKCVLLDSEGKQIGGIYLPTTGRPALQVLALVEEIEKGYGKLIGTSPIVACTTGSGRFLSQKILGAEYAVDEITCQAEGVKELFQNEEFLSIIEIGGEDSKFVQLQSGALFDYNMNPVCAAGTGTFLENLAELLGVSIREEFSEGAFSASYAVDLGDICTLISQSILASASARGLPLNEQLASLAYSSARNYIGKTVDKRPLEGKLVFTGATAKNRALAAALAACAGKVVHVPPRPELSGALGSAIMARKLHLEGVKGTYSFQGLSGTGSYTVEKQACRAKCKHEHRCMLQVIRFRDGNRFTYGDRCGRFSSIEKHGGQADAGSDYASLRIKIMEEAAGNPAPDGPSVGLARGGLYYEYYPFWAAFFRELGCRIVRSGKSGAKTLQMGKTGLDSEMCYPLKVILGHYRELQETGPDFIFLPEVVDMETPSWIEQWPRSFVCPLLQTLRGTVVNSIGLEPEKVLYAQLNYRSGRRAVAEQLRPAAKKVLGRGYREAAFQKALRAGYEAQSVFKDRLAAAAETMLGDLLREPERAAVVFLSRSYTLYDQFISKNSIHYARSSGMLALPHEFFYAFLQGWLGGEIDFPLLNPFREEFENLLREEVKRLDNIYPAQLQRMLTVAILVSFLNERRHLTGLPRISMILIDPFKCGPNAMLRHFLGSITTYLRLTVDEHTAAAGMITRLEAFRNTCLSPVDIGEPDRLSTATCTVLDDNWKKILIPDPTRHGNIIASALRRCGIEAEVLPRGRAGELDLAQRYANGEECLPFIQNLQDYLLYLDSNGNAGRNGEVFFQGWACGPCRYGLYAPAQALALNRAGFGEQKVCAIRMADVVKRCGVGFLLSLYNGMLAMDLLYKLLHRVRPYEKHPGRADELFEKYCKKLTALLQSHEVKPVSVLSGAYRKPLEKLLGEAGAEFESIPVKNELKPRILLGGEFYVRLDDRCNQSVIRRVEQAGGEVCLAPATEVFTYTIFIDSRESKQAFRNRGRPADLLKWLGFSLLLKLALRDEAALEKAAGELLHGLEEPAPREIMRFSKTYVSTHYGGEPPMTIGRASAFAGRERVSGAIFVAPFTCMPASVVEAQQGLLQDELGIPIVTVYYDGQESANRDELVDGLVFQAGQKLQQS